MASECPLGTLPQIGNVPEMMWANVIRRDRFGEPTVAFQVESVPVPRPGVGEVLVAVMAAGINYNNIWAARGTPVDVIRLRQKRGQTHDFHIGGSDASGVVYALGEGVDDLTLGDEVVLHPGWWERDDPWVTAGSDPMVAPSAAIWGYDTNFGSFAQFTVAQRHQVMPKAPHLTWEEAAAPTLVGTTAYRMLLGWPGHTLRPDDVVLVWGGSGGLGGQAIQLAKLHGALAVAVVSSADRGEYCLELGATGFVNRREFTHWGTPPHWTDIEGQAKWQAEARRFGSAVWDAVGRRQNPRIVFEHPGEDTMPTSVFVCEAGGMIVICAGTTGYSAVADLRYVWTRQKRVQGSHGTNDEQAYAYNELVQRGMIDPCLGSVFAFHEIGAAHEQMASGTLAPGNAVALVGAPHRGLCSMPSKT